jgi:hypothetical protein
MLVDRYLNGAHRIWAVVGAFGDNLRSAATALAVPLALTPTHLARLRELGETLNYNGYGDAESDLICHPVALYRILARYADPFSFMEGERIYGLIAAQRGEDMGRAANCAPSMAFAGATVHVLPDAAWSRRVRGVFANDLANRLPDLAHAVLTRNADGGYTVSIRTPQKGADVFCLAFPTGGGRAKAAGINDLPAQRLAEFAERFDETFPGAAQSATSGTGA